MSDEAKRDLRNVIVFALADGKLDDDEKRFIDSLRVKLGIDAAEFREVCAEVRKAPHRLLLPRDPARAAEAIRLLREIAETDGEFSESERRMLGRLVEHAGLDAATADELLGGSARDQGDDLAVSRLVDEVYEGFAGWSAERRREKLDELSSAGRAAIMPLLRVLESYRAPDGAPDALELKVLVAERLGGLGDKRAVYYLCQHVNVGDSESEISSAEFRFAAAEAIGRLVGEPFSRDRAGVDAARSWWAGPGMAQYDKLAL